MSHQSPALVNRETMEPGAAQSALTILTVDDHYLVREGLKLALRQLARRTEVLEAGNLVQAVALYREHPAIDLVLLDLCLPGRRGIEALEAFYASCPDARVVVLSALHDMRTVRAALGRGVCGFIPKLSGSSHLVNALRFVLAGDVYVPHEVLLQGGSTGAASPAPIQPLRPPPPKGKLHTTGLTTRQLDVLLLLLEGKSNRQICETLDLALGTVKTHVASVLLAMGVSNRSQAVSAVEGLGWREIVRALRRAYRR